MKNRLNTSGALALGLLALVAGVASAEDTFVAIKAKTVITATGEEYSPGIVVLRNGKVEAVGKKVELPPKARVIEAPDEVVMPGLVLARGFAGRPRGGNNAHLSVKDELVLRAGAFEEYAEAGFVAVALLAPGNGVTGQALVIRPIDGELDDLILDGAGFVRVTMTSLPGDKLTLRAAFKEGEQWIERIEKAKKAFEEAQKKAAEEAAKKKAAEEAQKKKEGTPAPKPGPQPQPPSPRPTPVPVPRPRPRPVPKRAPLPLERDADRDPAPDADEHADHDEHAEQESGSDAEKRREAIRKLGHEDHDDPNEGKLPPAVGIDPFATPPKQAPAKAPATFTAPKAPERAQIFMAFVQKPEDGLRVLLELNKASDWLHYEDGFKERKLDPMIYLDTTGFGFRNRGECDLYRIAPALGKAQAQVLVRPAVTFEPHTRTQRNLPQEMLAAGCTVAFVPSGDLKAYLAEVASLVHAGFDRKAAIEGMTIRPAEMLGLGAELGLLKKGYQGDLTFLSGDPFAPGTRVTRVVLGGEQVWPKENQ